MSTAELAVTVERSGEVAHPSLRRRRRARLAGFSSAVCKTPETAMVMTIEAKARRRWLLIFWPSSTHTGMCTR